jgi:ubiquinone/menaquinone biosynthesis C-methylase UbiE
VKTRETLIESYNRLAEDYAKRYCDELDKKPFDRQLLKRFVESLSVGKAVCDMGCGSGHVAEHLKHLGVDVLGIDLSPGMVEIAKKRYPVNDYRVGDMLELDLPDESLAGIVALYAIIHLKRDEICHAMKEMHRVLTPGGGLLVSFHQGKGVLHEDESLGQPVAFDCNLFESRDVRQAMEKTGFEVEMVAERTPYDFEFPTTRGYIWGTKPKE